MASTSPSSPDENSTEIPCAAACSIAASSE
jgi:hypothetical protein